MGARRKPSRDGLAALPHELRELGKAVLAALIAGAILVAMTWVSGETIPASADWGGDPLGQWAQRIGVVLGPVWVLLGPGEKQREGR